MIWWQYVAISVFVAIVVLSNVIMLSGLWSREQRLLVNVRRRTTGPSRTTI